MLRSPQRLFVGCHTCYLYPHYGGLALYGTAPNFFGLRNAHTVDYICDLGAPAIADKYRIAHDGSDFIVNYEACGTVGVYGTEQAAKQEIEVSERDDFMLQTARSLLKAAVEAHMWLHNIDRQAAHDWIREAAD
jgi:hypothetical protein